jgi:uncharacterized protein
MQRRKTHRSRPISERIGTKLGKGGLKMRTHTWKEAFEDALEGARAGVPRYQTFVGYCYDIGRGISQDVGLAAHWYKQAAQNGSTDGMYNLALMCEAGRGVQLDTARAIALYEQASRKGHLQSQSNLAVRYLEGRGVETNVAEGLRLLRKAARRGDGKAQFNLGRAYLRGEGVRKSVSHAETWLSRAAESGHSKAHRLLESTRVKSAANTRKSSSKISSDSGIEQRDTGQNRRISRVPKAGR